MYCKCILCVPGEVINKPTKKNALRKKSVQSFTVHCALLQVFSDVLEDGST